MEAENVKYAVDKVDWYFKALTITGVATFVLSKVFVYVISPMISAVF